MQPSLCFSDSAFGLCFVGVYAECTASGGPQVLPQATVPYASCPSTPPPQQYTNPIYRCSFKYQYQCSLPSQPHTVEYRHSLKVAGAFPDRRASCTVCGVLVVLLPSLDAIAYRILSHFPRLMWRRPAGCITRLLRTLRTALRALGKTGALFRVFCRSWLV